MLWKKHNKRSETLEKMGAEHPQVLVFKNCYDAGLEMQEQQHLVTG